MGAAVVPPPDALFARVAANFVKRNRDGLVCKEGSYKACSVLKLQKRSWTNEPMNRVENSSGIFFSIWTNEASIRKNRAYYNLHALKLRELEGYSISSRSFAIDFRKGFASVCRDWPNVRMNYGPLTLMEGWIEIDSVRFEEDILRLMERFQSLSPLVDRLLESRQKLATRLVG